MNALRHPIVAFVFITAVLLLLALLTAPADAQPSNLTGQLAIIGGVGAKVILLALVSLLLPWPLKDRAVALFLLVAFIETVPSLLEYYFFSTRTIEEIIRMLGIGLLDAALAAGLVAWLFLPDAESTTFGSAMASMLKSRGAASWVWRLAASAATYLLLYLVIGGIAFQFTEPYYTDPAYGLELTLPEGGLGLIAILQPIRALIFILGLASLLAGLSLPGRQRGLIVGLVLFVLGGLAPLLAGAPNWPFELKIYHGIEIFFQNFPAGYIFAAWLTPARDSGP